MLDTTATRSPAELLIEALEERERRARQRKFFHLYPDETQRESDGTVTELWDGTQLWARKLYPRHLEFFEASATFREVGLVAANRCITPWTWVETASGERLSVEAWSATGCDVLSWADGSECASRSSDALLVGIEPAFRLVLGSGRFFDCSRRHRVLTTSGWLDLDQLVSLSSGLRCWHKREDYQASCAAGGHLGDRPLRRLAGIDLAQPRTPFGAQRRIPMVYELPDEAEQILERIRAYPEYGRLSTPDGLRRFVGLFSLFSGSSSERSYLSLSEGSENERRLAQALGAHLQSFAEHLPGQFGDDDLLARLASEYLDAQGKKEASFSGYQGDPLFRNALLPGGSTQEFRHEMGHMAIFYPWDHPSLVGGETIAAIVPIGLQPIVDAHVPKYNNYKAAGVYHHNTGKSFCGCYSDTCHLTGLYPEWWPGRRFPKPIKAWACGKTYETTKTIMQATLLGDVLGSHTSKRLSGTGLVPGHLIDPASVTWRQGVNDLVDTVRIKHVTGGWSTLSFKSAQQGRGAFEGTAQHLIHLDEEFPLDIYMECLTRTATTNGLIIATWTPLDGQTETVELFYPKEA